MKKFFVAAFCTLLMSGSLLAQEAATNVAPVAPVEDVAVAPVAQTAFTGSVVAGCNNCGSVVAPVYAPMTYTAAPQGCSSCGTVATPVTYTSMQDPAPVASGCGCETPATSCCDPCAQGRQGFRSRRQARVASRRAGRGSSNCCGY